jgi:hypothetical protein
MSAVRPILCLCLTSLMKSAPAADQEATVRTLDISPKPIHDDESVLYDYDIVYVRARRAGDKVHKRFYTDIAAPVPLEPAADLNGETVHESGQLLSIKNDPNYNESRPRAVVPYKRPMASTSRIRSHGWPTTAIARIPPCFPGKADPTLS